MLFFPYKYHKFQIKYWKAIMQAELEAITFIIPKRYSEHYNYCSCFAILQLFLQLMLCLL